MTNVIKERIKGRMGRYRGEWEGFCVTLCFKNVYRHLKLFLRGLFSDLKHFEYLAGETKAKT